MNSALCEVCNKLTNKELAFSSSEEEDIYYCSEDCYSLLNSDDKRLSQELGEKLDIFAEEKPKFIGRDKDLKTSSAQKWLDKHYPQNGVFRIKIAKLAENSVNYFNILDINAGIDSVKKINKDIDNSGKGRSEITELFIFKENIRGKLDLGDFINLKELDCSNNKLTQLILPKNNKIKILDFSNNLLTSFDYSVLNNETLKILDLSNNNLESTDISIFNRLFNLTHLEIGNRNYWIESDHQGNKFTGSLKSLKNLIKLESLNIINTDISSGLEYLSNSLEEFYLYSLEDYDYKVKEIEKCLPKNNNLLKEINTNIRGLSRWGINNRAKNLKKWKKDFYKNNPNLEVNLLESIEEDRKKNQEQNQQLTSISTTASLFLGEEIIKNQSINELEKQLKESKIKLEITKKESDEQIQRLQLKIQKLEQKNQNKLDNLQEKSEQIIKNIDQKKQEVKDLQSEIDQKEEIIKINLSNEEIVKELRKEIIELKKQIEIKEQELTELKKQLDHQINQCLDYLGLIINYCEKKEKSKNFLLDIKKGDLFLTEEYGKNEKEIGKLEEKIETIIKQHKTQPKGTEHNSLGHNLLAYLSNNILNFGEKLVKVIENSSDCVSEEVKKTSETVVNNYYNNCKFNQGIMVEAGGNVDLSRASACGNNMSNSIEKQLSIEEEVEFASIKESEYQAQIQQP